MTAREINADIEDPNDPDFIYSGRVIVIREGPGDSDYRWSRIYLPTQRCLAWDAPPKKINVAIGYRTGFTYADLKLAGQIERVPGGWELGQRGAIIRFSFNFDRGVWEPTPRKTCWVVSPIDK